MTLACVAARKSACPAVRGPAPTSPVVCPGGCGFRHASTRAARFLPALAVLAALLLAGCGKGSQTAGQARAAARCASVAPVAAEGAVSVTTRNTTRVGGADPVGRRRRGRPRRLPGPDDRHAPAGGRARRPQRLARRARGLAARRRAAERADPLRRRRLAAAGQPRSARSDAPDAAPPRSAARR